MGRTTSMFDLHLERTAARAGNDSWTHLPMADMEFRAFRRHKNKAYEAAGGKDEMKLPRASVKGSGDDQGSSGGRIILDDQDIVDDGRRDGADYLAVHVGLGTAVTVGIMSTLLMLALALQLSAARHVPWIYRMNVVPGQRFESHRVPARFCRGYDEVCNFFHPRSRRSRQVPTVASWKRPDRIRTSRPNVLDGATADSTLE